MFNFIISLSERYWSLCVPRMPWSRVLGLGQGFGLVWGHPRLAYHTRGTQRQSGRGIRKPRRERAAPRPCASETASIWLSHVNGRQWGQQLQPATSRDAPNRKQQKTGETHPARNGSKPGDSSIGRIGRTNNSLELENEYPVEWQKGKRPGGHQHVHLWNRAHNTRLPTATRLSAANQALLLSDSLVL